MKKYVLRTYLWLRLLIKQINGLWNNLYGVIKIKSFSKIHDCRSFTVEEMGEKNELW